MKVCSRCKVEKDDNQFRPCNKYLDGLFSYCNQCVKEKSTEYRRNRGIKPMKRREELKPLPDFKICSRCLQEKPKESFRVRVQDKRYRYLNSTCRECDSELAAEYYWKQRSPEFLKKKAERTKRYNSERKEQISEKNRKKRQTQEYKEYVKKYRDIKKNIISKQEEVTKKRYHEKHRDAISDKYATNLLRNQGNRNPTKEEIEIKKTQILISRIKDKISRKNGKNIK